MANIYEQQSEHLYQLLDRARSEEGATVLIPDLQRPYVWTPSQVTLLIDSLIRGWPFGTLLMWKLAPGELQSIPHRPFWKVVDRTVDEGGSTVTRRDPPASFHMVLDGQQRVQSLLLALSGDGWGFKLEDRRWAEELQDRRPRGRQGKYKHWSKACLCFDVDRFMEEYRVSGTVLGVDYRNVLQWVVTDPNEGQSPWKKAAGYNEPLLKSFDPANKGRFVRLSRLWAAATVNPNIREAQFRKIAEDLFAAEGVPAEKTKEALQPLGELMATFKDVKLANVTYLELLPYDKEVAGDDDAAYNDAIVNIFTRLNTAGRALSREEITLAWLKVGWNPAETGDRTAGKCFQELLDELADRRLAIGIDDLVSAVSLIWSACANGGKLLANKDLLRGAVVRPMAADLATRWTNIERAVLEAMDAVNARGLEYGSAGQYASLNALAIVWAWNYLAMQWSAGRVLKPAERDDFEKRCRKTLDDFLDRWLLCSQWAGRWSGASQTILEGYVRDLSGDFEQLKTAGTIDEAHQVLANRTAILTKGLEEDAAAYIASLAAASRDRVSVYRNTLWIWHRLDEARWAKSRISLRTNKTGKVSLDVDHAVAFALWENLLTGIALPAPFEDIEDAKGFVNKLGNCSLLEKTFNISKSAKPLKALLDQVHEFKNGNETIAGWSAPLQLAPAMIEPTAALVGDIVAAIEKRDGNIRQEVIAFVKGQKIRVDL